MAGEMCRRRRRRTVVLILFRLVRGLCVLRFPQLRKTSESLIIEVHYSVAGNLS